HLGGICAMWRFRANGVAAGQRLPRFFHRRRALDCLRPSWSDRRCPALGGSFVGGTGGRGTRFVSLACQHGRVWVRRRELCRGGGDKTAKKLGGEKKGRAY